MANNFLSLQTVGYTDLASCHYECKAITDPPKTKFGSISISPANLLVT